MAMLTTQALTPGMIDQLSGDYEAMMNPMLQKTGDAAFDAKRQEMFAQNAALQNNNEPLRVDVGTSPIPQNEMIATPPETMTLPQQNAMLTKQPQNLIEAALMGVNAPEGQAPFSDYVKGNWQGLIQQGIEGLQENSMRENLPADIYLKLKTVENEKALAEQNQFLNNLKLQADLDYQRQSIDLKKEELMIERQKALTGGDLPASIKQTQWYMNADPESRAIYDRTNKIGIDKVDIGGKTVFIDKVTGQTVGEIDKTLAPDQLPETKEAQAAATKRGTEMGDAEAKLQSMEASMPTLENVTGRLSKLGKIATYTKTGQARDAALRELGMDIPDAAVARTEYISTVDNEVLPLLRQTFGAAFTASEGERLRVTLGDPDKTPEEKDAVLRSFITAKKGEIDSLRRQTGQPAAPSHTAVDPSLLEFMTPEERALFQ